LKKKKPTNQSTVSHQNDRVNKSVAVLLFAGSEETAGLVERAPLPVLQRGPGAGEGRCRALGRRRVFPGRARRQTAWTRPTETEATAGQRVGRGRLRARRRPWRPRRPRRRPRWRLRRRSRLRRRRRRRDRRADRQVRTVAVRRQAVVPVAVAHRSHVSVGRRRRLSSSAGPRQRPMIPSRSRRRPYQSYRSCNANGLHAVQIHATPAEKPRSCADVGTSHAVSKSIPYPRKLLSYTRPIVVDNSSRPARGRYWRVYVYTFFRLRFGRDFVTTNPSPVCHISSRAYATRGNTVFAPCRRDYIRTIHAYSIFGKNVFTCLRNRKRVIFRVLSSTASWTVNRTQRLRNK